jgi:hypothetical protein
MKLKKRPSASITLLLMTVSMTVAFAAAQSPTPAENVLVSFPASGDLGNSPNGVLISDAAGNFYGVNTYGGTGSGAAYEISPTTEGGWTAKSIYVFPTSTYFPAGLVMDSSGNLYGANYGGGTETCSDGYGDYSCGAPTAGKVGQHILILGNRLSGTTSVTFNGVPANFTVKSDTYIRATVPAGATTGTVSVVTPGGMLNSNPQFIVTK